MQSVFHQLYLVFLLLEHEHFPLLWFRHRCQRKMQSISHQFYFVCLFLEHEH